MKHLIIPTDMVEKLKSIEFPKPHKLEPVKGELDGVEVYFLQAELKENTTFEKALADFAVCEIKDIATIEQKYYDSSSVEIKPTITTSKTGVTTTKYIVDSKEADPMTLTVKTVLTEAKIIVDPIKIDPIVTK